MHDNLVIVESPAKAKTIEKFLGKDFVVKSSYGHIRDLPKKGLGIDLGNNFAPDYEVSPDKAKVVADLKKSAKEAKTVWLASDEDREGEAIAWHLAKVLGLDEKNTKRIVFHEITKKAILDAVANPRTIDMDKVNSQQARRILDRLVGFELSPVLWKKVKPSLSAGRVQSVAVRLIVEREREIMAFDSKAYYRVTTNFQCAEEGKKSQFKAELNKRFETQEEAHAFLELCKTALFTISRIDKKPSKKSPAAPFTTSTLQQEAGRKFGMAVGQTMSVAQKLYEAGYITYMRTDSVNLSGQAIAAAKEQIVKLYGEKYSEVRNYKTKSKGAQEAHEAIRPSYMEKSSIEGTPQEKRLYELIWKRTMASQMAGAETERTVVDIDISGAAEKFVATGEIVKFDGFLRLYAESVEDTADDDNGGAILPPLKEGNHPEAIDITAAQRFTQSPPRYSEASLVKRLEELGIGRPSTYAPTISTVINRGYVIRENHPGTERKYEVLTLKNGTVSSETATETTGREKNKLSPTDIGILVTDYLDEQFPAIMNYNFTATVEKEFDEIADGEKEWVDMLRKFYTDFHVTIDEAMESAHVKNNQVRELGVDPKSGKPVSVRMGRFGPVAQIGGENGEKPQFASLKKGQLIASVTLDEALELFSLPRSVGEYEGKDVVIGIGKFGPYVRHDGKFVSLAKTDDPYTVTLDRAVELITEKRVKDIMKNTPLKTFAEEPELLVLNGRYGPYISFDGKNYRIPKGTTSENLTLEQARKIITAKTAK